jgi:hypothetical protein
MKKIAVALRGHERHSFDNKNLHDHLKNLSNFFDLDIYIHTWNESEAKASWRPVSKIRKEINENIVQQYFEGLNVKKIIVENDEDVQLHGRKNGLMGRIKKIECSKEILEKILLEEIGEWAQNHRLKTYLSSSHYDIFVEVGCPIIGWKKMWHGIYTIIKCISDFDINYDGILNCRLDILNYTNNPLYKNNKEFPQVDLGLTINLINSFLKQKKILFIKDTNCMCIDNIYIGSVKNILQLSEKFHYNLDDVLEEHKIEEWTANQEKLVFLQAKKISEVLHI